MDALPNAAEPCLAETIRRIGAKGFEGALHQWLRRAVPHDNLIALAYRASGPPIVLYRQSDAPQVFVALDTTYLAGAYLLDPFHDLHLSRVAPGAYRMRDVAPDAFHRSRYFQAYYRQTTLIDEIAFVAYPAPGLTLNVCLGRDACSGQPFAPRDIDTAQRIAPVVVALTEAHWSGLAAAPADTGDTAARLIAAAEAAHGIRLSPRQAEVALMILRGHSSVSIGLRLGVSPQTVKVFRKQLYARCAISSQAELFALMMPLLADRAPT